MSSDRNLLFGLLALQNGFISKEQLVAAFSVWILEKSASIESILLKQTSMKENIVELLHELLRHHLEHFGNDAARSLATLSSIGSVKSELKALGDAELLQSMQVVATEPQDMHATLSMAPTPDAKRFVVLRPFARGGLGQVSVALDSELNRHVALKEILADQASDPTNQARFVQEAEITGQLEHPGIVPVYGLGSYGDGRPFYAMRFVEGENLKTAIQQFHEGRTVHQQLEGDKVLAFRNLLGRFVDVCNAIEYAHSRHVLHRDLKPENILLGPYGETLVVDWGLAKPLTEEAQSEGSERVRPITTRSVRVNETIDGSTLGTPAYMSPEQAMGRIHELGPATDIYSLGATLYAILTGRPPVSGASVEEVLERVRKHKLDPPRVHWHRLPPALEAICMKALALEKRDRYETPKHLASDIEKWLADEPVSVFRESLAMRTKRWVKRHPSAVSALAVAVICGLGASIFIAFLNGAHARELGSKNELLAAANSELAQKSNEITQKNVELGEKIRLTAAQAEENRVLAKAKDLEAKRTKAFADVLMSMFQSADPLALEGLGLRKGGESVREISALDLLKRASSSVTQDEKIPVEVRIKLKDSLGDALRSVGDYRLASTLLDQAIKEATNLAEPNLADLLSIEFHLAKINHDTRRSEAAKNHYEKALALCQELEQKEGIDLTELRNQIQFRFGWLLAELHEVERAAELFNQVKKDRLRIFGSGDESVQLVTIAAAFNEHRVVNPLKFMQIIEELPKETSSALLKILKDYIVASMLRGQGRKKVAVDAYEAMLPKVRALFPEHHPVVGLFLGDMAGACREAGDLGRAIELAKECVDIALQVMPSHPEAVKLYLDLGQTLHSQGRDAEAIEHYKRVLERVELAESGVFPADAASEMRKRLQELEALKKE